MSWRAANSTTEPPTSGCSKWLICLIGNTENGLIDGVASFVLLSILQRYCDTTLLIVKVADVPTIIMKH